MRGALRVFLTTFEAGGVVVTESFGIDEDAVMETGILLAVAGTGVAVTDLKPVLEVSVVMHREDVGVLVGSTDAVYTVGTLLVARL